MDYTSESWNIHCWSRISGKIFSVFLYTLAFPINNSIMESYFTAVYIYIHIYAKVSNHFHIQKNYSRLTWRNMLFCWRFILACTSLLIVWAAICKFESNIKISACFQVREITALYLHHNRPAWYQFITSTFCHSNW